eukprot:TRINITY_DN59006_c0_g2_i1.p2 TRINITY_DN59006_c0_g2~~TRINITY_DN59006_c0_g2_i1.p2  ORF type:complete len:132 (-),score=5.85 TRINITY_DN59006_c0_g2_i1:400-795(-)
MSPRPKMEKSLSLFSVVVHCGKRSLTGSCNPLAMRINPNSVGSGGGGRVATSTMTFTPVTGLEKNTQKISYRNSPANNATLIFKLRNRKNTNGMIQYAIPTTLFSIQWPVNNQNMVVVTLNIINPTSTELQ